MSEGTPAESAAPGRNEPQASSPGLRPITVLRDGLLAGALGAVVVAIAHGVADLAAGDPLHTPSVLGVLVSEGVEAARSAGSDIETAIRFTGLHLTLWALLGIVGSLLISIVDSRPKLASLVFSGFAFVFISASYLVGAFSIPGLAPLHLWVGTLLGSASAAGYLGWRHPHLAGHIQREHLTETTLREISRALALETRGAAAFAAAAARFPDSALARIVEAKRGHVKILEELAEDLGLEQPPPGEPPGPPSDAAAALRTAIAHEREVVELYDRFLAVVPEVRVRDVFLRLRYHAVDQILPQLQKGLDDDA